MNKRKRNSKIMIGMLVAVVALGIGYAAIAGINLLINGPDNLELTNCIPNNTQLLDANIQNGCVILNFSQEITNFSNEEQKFNIIKCILNTLSQLNEVNSIKFLINNEQTSIFGEE